MSVWVSTYKLNELKMSTTTVDHLESKDGDLPFHVYLDKENEEIALANMKHPEYQHDIWNYDNFIAAYRNYPDELTVGHLGMVYNWLHQIYEIWKLPENVSNDILDQHGFEEVSEIGERDKSWIYMHELGNYMDFREVEGNVYDHGLYLYENQMYKDGLNYLLILLNKVCFDKKYLANEKYSIEDMVLLNGHTETKLECALAEERLINIRDTTEKEDKDNSSYRRSLDAYYYSNAYYMYRQLKELQQKLQSYKGQVFINYSY